MYFPYFRGKQFELIALRENAELLSGSDIIPIIEPVRASLSGLKRCIDTLMEHDCEFILVGNPLFGEMKEDNEPIVSDVLPAVTEYSKCSIGYLVGYQTNFEIIPNSADILHYADRNGRDVARGIEDTGVNVGRHVYFGNKSARYRRNFTGDHENILIQDGFFRRKNREYPPSEFFSDVHLEFSQISMDGFGDFLIVGDDYSDEGGPAWTVAIHLTYFDDEEEGEMYIKHYKSDPPHSQTDPGGKFLEALGKLVEDANTQGSKIRNTQAVQEFFELHDRSHFPGLGYVKKLSMQHHLEIFSEFLNTL